MRQPTPITLANEAVTLKPITINDLQAFYEAGKNDDIWRWTPPHQCATLTTAEQWLRHSLAQVAKGEQVMFAIIDNASGCLVGSTRYCSIDTENSGIEIGFTFINEKFQRSHINSNSKLLLLSHAFEELGAVRVQLRTHEKNQKSRNAISRLGATFEGILRNHRLLSTGEYRNTALFSLLTDEWPQSKAMLQNKIIQNTVVKQVSKKQPNLLTDKHVSLIKEYPLAQLIIASNDNLHEQIIYLPVRLDRKNNRLIGHMSIHNKLLWLLENSTNVTVVFQGDDAYISPLLDENIKVPTWNYRRLHISGEFSFLAKNENRRQVQMQVEALEGKRWSMDDQPAKMINSMLANILCFEINIERVDKIFKLDSQKPIRVKQAIAGSLVNKGKLSLAAAHLAK
ncbi:hypothetical protein GCM10007916_21800 [Psychromonas marina]|uniref:N-acetyltransferase domain-containing protein n=1 Tax=Psychromonas marina TaxID=88364 RepID=A0ABQ6E2B4_9GAMM|nr:GNAT family N-acetyltransferase [Psychromonas marina]GLS91111.1 hypothetical protein GCM10007916_21800 [Psychromonas marina]